MTYEEKWIVTDDDTGYAQTDAETGVHPVLVRIAKNRGITSEEELEKFFSPKWKHLQDATRLKNAQAAADLLRDMIARGDRIRIIGDYDIDGICATVILYQCLFACHAKVDYCLPHRIRDGYGLNEKLIREAKADGCDVILTCDNGIAAIEEIRLAKELGMQVIITDHHEPVRVQDGMQYRYPPADLIVNPRQENETYPYPGICGAVVAWLVMRILCKEMQVPAAGGLPYALTFIDLAAIATIGDVMELVDENRTIVSLGLRYIHSTKRTGLLALIEENGLQPWQVQAYHIGFVIGPCMNASGRLDTAERAAELLLEQDMTRAHELAAELVELNISRKNMTTQGVDEAIRQVEGQGLLCDSTPVLVVYLPDCHESLAGIIAGKLRERYYRPVFVLTKGEDCVKGSGRSIPGYHMQRKMSEIADVFLKFGGHAGAAGLSIEEKRIEEFRDRINQAHGLTTQELTPLIRIDARLLPGQVDNALVEGLKLLEPCGNGNEKPRFLLEDVAVEQARRFGRDGNVLKLVLEKDGELTDAIYFGDVDEWLGYYRVKYGKEQVDRMIRGQRTDLKISVIGYPQMDHYAREERAQFVIRHYK